MSPAVTDTLDFSVVICAYTERRWEALIEAVESLERQTVPPREVIVVIDHNEALLQRALERFRDLSVPVAVIENHQERGLSGARNSGVAAASAAIIAFLDDDAAADERWLEFTRDAFLDERVMGVGATIDLDWQGPAPQWFPAEFNWTVGGTYRGMPTSRAPVRNLIGAAMAIRGSLLKGSEGFRSVLGRTDAVKLPLGGEETELCIRLKQRHPANHFVYEPRANVKHKVTLDRATWRYFTRRCYAEGLSKAHMSRLVGKQDGLSSERAYVLQALPSGVLRGVRDTVFKRDLHGLGRSAAIVLGLLATATGFLVGSKAPKNTTTTTTTAATTVP